MDEIEIPQFFVCPISLQIMKDPVTTVTGITYDRDSIEHWLYSGENTSCPVTKQPLPKELDITPNHTLRRLIQAWCMENASNGIDRIPTPKSCPDKSHFLKILRVLKQQQHHQDSQTKTLRQLELLAVENERNRKQMVEAGVPKALLLFVVSCYKKSQTGGLQEALSILRYTKIPSSELSAIVNENDHIVSSITWILGCNLDHHIKSNALELLKLVFQEASSRVLERLKPEIFENIIDFLRGRSLVTQEGVKAALHVMLEACPYGRNRIKMVEYGAVFELIEIELGSCPEKRTTELIFAVLFHLCCCADGRAQFLGHGGGIAVLAKRILRVSSAVDDRAVLILALICKFSGTSLVFQELLEVKAVTKLCSMLQVDCAPYLKDKAREILRSHFDEWKDSPCITAPSLERVW